jgi:hypothetical protein
MKRLKWWENWLWSENPARKQPVPHIPCCKIHRSLVVPLCLDTIRTIRIVQYKDTVRLEEK